jgi:hypothetical protein
LDDEEFGIDQEEREIPSNEIMEPEANGEEESEIHEEPQESEPQAMAPVIDKKQRNNAARRVASAAKLIMSYETPIGSSPAELEYVSLKKDAVATRRVKAAKQSKQDQGNVNSERHPHGRVEVPNQLFRHLKSTPVPAPPAPPAAPVDPELEEKKRNRAARFGIPMPPPVPTVEVTSVAQDPVTTAPRGKKRNTGGIIAADAIDEDVSSIT